MCSPADFLRKSARAREMCAPSGGWFLRKNREGKCAPHPVVSKERAPGEKACVLSGGWY